jgi:hypothetical protein
MADEQKAPDPAAPAALPEGVVAPANDPHPGRMPDALKVPAGIAKNRGTTPEEYIRRRWGPLFGVAVGRGRLWCANMATYNFVIPSQSNSAVAPRVRLKFARTHPRDGEDRYEWHPQPDGTSVGYLVDGTHPTDPNLDPWPEDE